MKTLIDVGVKHGGIDSMLETNLRRQIKDAASFAAKKNIDSLRNRQVGHYDLMAPQRHSLTTVHPTKEEIRDYFDKLAAILEACAERARFCSRPFSYKQFEESIHSTSQMIIAFIRKGTKV